MTIGTLYFLMVLVTTFVGILGGGVLCYIFLVPKTFGTLRIDHTNPEKDVYRLDIDELDKLSDKKKIVLKVDNYADLTQK